MPLFTCRAVTAHRVPAAVVAAALLCAPGGARAVNVAPRGEALMGLNTGVNSDLGTPYSRFNTPGTLKDRDPTTHDDTWNESWATTHSYVGVLLSTPRPEFVTAVSVDMALFAEGGWFGPNGVSPGPFGTLTAEQLTAPAVQVTADAGRTWQTVPDRNDYVFQLTGATLPAASAAPTAARTATFNLLAPVSGIHGIRLIGPEGGPGGGGFIGVFEIGVEAVVPEPASLGAVGLAGMLALRRRHRA